MMLSLLLSLQLDKNTRKFIGSRPFLDGEKKTHAYLIKRDYELSFNSKNIEINLKPAIMLLHG